MKVSYEYRIDGEKFTGTGTLLSVGQTRDGYCGAGIGLIRRDSDGQVVEVHGWSWKALKA